MHETPSNAVSATEDALNHTKLQFEREAGCDPTSRPGAQLAMSFLIAPGSFMEPTGGGTAPAGSFYGPVDDYDDSPGASFFGPVGDVGSFHRTVRAAVRAVCRLFE